MRRRMRDGFAPATGELLAQALDHLPLCRHKFQRLGGGIASLRSAESLQSDVKRLFIR
jgi:hypothetical protein